MSETVKLDKKQLKSYGKKGGTNKVQLFSLHQLKVSIFITLPAEPKNKCSKIQTGLKVKKKKNST